MTDKTKETLNYIEVNNLKNGLMIIKDSDLNNFKDIKTPEFYLSLKDIGFFINKKTNKYELKDKTIAIIVNGDELSDKYNADAFIKKHILKMREFKYLVCLVG